MTHELGALVVAGVLLSAPEVAYPVTVGVIMDEDTPYYQRIHEALVETIRAARDDVEIFVQTPSTTGLARANAARRLEALDVDVAVTYGANATAVVAREAKDVPVVYAVVHSGRFRAPGTRSTGVEWRAPLARVVKWLQSIEGFSELGLIAAERDDDSLVQVRALKELGSAFGFGLKAVKVQKEIQSARVTGVDAVLLANSCVSSGCIAGAVAAARAAKAPSAAMSWSGSPSGVLLSVAVDPAELGRMAAEMALAVLDGRSPETLPSSQATSVLVVVDLKEAKSLELDVPTELLRAATRKIQ